MEVQQVEGISEKYSNMVIAVNHLLELVIEIDHVLLTNTIQNISNLLGDESSIKMQIKKMKACLPEIQSFAMTHGLTKQYEKLYKNFQKNLEKKNISPIKELTYTLRVFQSCFTLLHIYYLIQTQKSPSNSKTIIWVDDVPANNSNEVNNAQVKHMIYIIQLTDTDAAVKYLKDNYSKYGTSGSECFRIISDYFRPEEGDQAAAELIRRAREQGFKRTPILIFCSEKTNFFPLIAGDPFVLASTTSTVLNFFFRSMNKFAEAPNSKKLKREPSDSSKFKKLKQTEKAKEIEVKPLKKSNSELSAGKMKVDKVEVIMKEKEKEKEKVKEKEQGNGDNDESTQSEENITTSLVNLKGTLKGQKEKPKFSLDDMLSDEEEPQSKQQREIEEWKKKKEIAMQSIAKERKNLEENERLKKEKEKKDLEEKERLRKEKELEEKERLRKEKEERMLKEKKEAEERMKKEKEEKERLKKEKEERLLREKKEQEERLKKEQEERLKKEMEEKERLKKEQEKRDLEEKLKKEKEKKEKEEKLKREIEERLRKEMEEKQRLKKEKKEKKEEEARKGKERLEQEKREQDKLKKEIEAKEEKKKKDLLVEPEKNKKRKINQLSLDAEENPKKKPKSKIVASASSSDTEELKQQFHISQYSQTLTVGTLSSFYMSQINYRSIKTNIIEVEFKGPTQFDGYVTQESDSKYKITFFPTKVGDYLVSMKCNGSPIVDSPTTLSVVSSNTKESTKSDEESIDYNYDVISSTKKDKEKSKTQNTQKKEIATPITKNKESETKGGKEKPKLKRESFLKNKKKNLVDVPSPELSEELPRDPPKKIMVTPPLKNKENIKTSLHSPNLSSSEEEKGTKKKDSDILKNWDVDEELDEKIFDLISPASKKQLETKPTKQWKFFDTPSKEPPNKEPPKSINNLPTQVMDD